MVKLAVEEAESKGTWLYAERVQWVSSELVVTELSRAIRRKAALDPSFDLAAHRHKADIILQEVALQPLSRLVVWRAGRSFDPHLGSLDAIHLMTALELPSISAFVTYDERQAKAARKAGLNVRSPGA